MRRAVFSLAIILGPVLAAPSAAADTPHGNFTMRVDGRYDFHTWIWNLSQCDGECVHVQAIPQPIAKAFAYTGDAQLRDGRYTLTVDVPDGLRCGDVYYGPVIPTHDVYEWDARSHTGTLTSSFNAGCDGAPGGTLSYPLELTLM